MAENKIGIRKGNIARRDDYVTVYIALVEACATRRKVR